MASCSSSSEETNDARGTLPNDRTALPRAEDHRPSTSGVVPLNVSLCRPRVNWGVLPLFVARQRPSAMPIRRPAHRVRKIHDRCVGDLVVQVHPQRSSTAAVERNSAGRVHHRQSVDPEGHPDEGPETDLDLLVQLTEHRVEQLQIDVLVRGAGP